jgi:hypothetical protein
MATSTKSNIELLKEVQQDLRSSITEARFEYIEKLRELKSFGGEDLTEESLLALIQKYPGGIAYPFLQTAFPEAALTKAREALKKAGKIEQQGKKGNIILKPVTIK